MVIALSISQKKATVDTLSLFLSNFGAQRRQIYFAFLSLYGFAAAEDQGKHKKANAKRKQPGGEAEICGECRPPDAQKCPILPTPLLGQKRTYPCTVVSYHESKVAKYHQIAARTSDKQKAKWPCGFGCGSGSGSLARP